ncbi:MAG: glycosyltransferase family 4 protein [Paludibacteraceae bacterium]|nr:glycosyltransferase family 4 protein [Paludibacteraceae bacterium]
MVSVVKNYLGYNWKDVKIKYVPTHIQNKALLIPFFAVACLRIIIYVLFNKPQIAHLHTAERGSFYRKAFLVRLLKRLGVKTIMHHHAAEFEEFYANLSDKKKSYVNSSLEKTDVNIVLSKRLIPMIKNKASRANVKVLYNAVNTYKENPYNIDEKNILFLGRLGKRKGTYDFLDAFKMIDKDIDSNIKLYLCGDGEVKEVSAYAEKLGLKNRIAHIGWIDGNQKQEFMSHTMINVLPSYNEGLPMTIIETMAYGIPNISTPIASIPEVIHEGETGFLFEPGDKKALAERIKNLINDKKKRFEISTNSYNLITNTFSLDKNIEKLVDIYKGLIKGN